MKFFLKLSIPFLILGIAYYVWYVHFQYRLETISPNKVYKSALIPPDKIEGFLLDNKIKTVIDLLHPELNNALNPAGQSNIDEEDSAIKQVNAKHNLSIQHINIQSDQVPSKENLEKFFEILDDKSNYPVLIHCYHGTGRAQIYSALYRIEYESWKNEDARAKTRVIVSGLGYKSSFSDSKPKGKFLINYKTRKEQK
ncbi:Tyrosine/serine protein phosphatase [hydrothermal vent metagenome]|uniref:Tyrosine/serine protein phosphatase n=1 Tax=hydrothermal vent metagenome TaxID=652676 RepID=A0A1W1D177_9ZZZZ